ncbi:hypothetical protein chiPu_0024043, partial [Chiloscyllium punctatum]|nr:hypothetical protein [Chiloscyllium punctatum]
KAESKSTYKDHLSFSPFYGEDFYCEIPRTFRYLAFYIFDRDVFRRDSIIDPWLYGSEGSIQLFSVLKAEQEN